MSTTLSFNDGIFLTGESSVYSLMQGCGKPRNSSDFAAASRGIL